MGGHTSMNFCIHIECYSDDAYKQIEEICKHELGANIDFVQSWESWLADQGRLPDAPEGE
jgi:hypothetical protein